MSTQLPRWTSSTIQDVTYTLRSLRRSPGFTAAALLTLVLGIGANTAMFSIVNGVLLQPLPYADADRLVSLHQANPKRGIQRGRISYLDFEDWRHAQSFAAMAAYDVIPQTLTGHGDAIEVQAAYITADFFSVLGVPAHQGRTLDASDYRSTSRHAVISDRLWRTRLNANPAVLGQAILMRGQPFTVVGVMTPDFRYPSPEVDVWLPESVLDPRSIGPRIRPNRVFEAVGRIRPGASIAAADAELNTIAARLAVQYPQSNHEWTAVTVVPLRTALVGDVSRALVLLLTIVGFILLIACVNVANLLLARSAGRTSEIAIRTALGAGRGRLIRQLLSENLVLALLGGVLALLLTVWTVQAVVALSADTLPRVESVRVDGRVVSFGLGLALITGLLCGLAPAFRVGLGEPQHDLKSGGRGTAGYGRLLRRVLVCTEVALALVLVIGAGLMARSFLQLRSVDPGFDPEGVLTVSLQLNLAGVPPSAIGTHILARRQDIIDRVSKLPGVLGVGMTDAFPLRDDGNVFEFTRIDGRTPQDNSAFRAETRLVSPDYIGAMRIPLRRGTALPDRWPKDAPVPALVSETAARRYWPGEDALGLSVRAPWGAQLQIIGIVGDVRNVRLAQEPAPAIYLPQTAAPRLLATVVVRTAGDPLALAAPIRQVMRELDPNQPIRSIETLNRVKADSIARDRFFTILFGMFGALALILAAVGVYGVVAYSVGQRTREMGLRMALGARAADVLRLIVREGMTPVVVGLALGAAAALLLVRALDHLLYGVSAVDPMTFVIAPTVLASAALLACYIPARRAIRIDPMHVLRTD